MRQLVLWVVIGMSGCSYEPLPRIAADAPSDSLFPFCRGTRPRICLPAKPAGTVMLSLGIEINTDNSIGPPLACEPSTDHMDYCVIAAENITIAETVKLRALGRRPLVLLASGTIDVKGVIDVSSTSAATIEAGAGAGADPATCPQLQAATGTAGGAGGSFGGKGGDGQVKMTENSPEGIAGKAAEPLPELPDLRGGCRGGDGGDVGNIRADSSAGVGGHGGGAIALIAAEIRISGTINASGAGGTGRPEHVAEDEPGIGGGGGGSGGMISLDAPSLVATTLFANGGGGACGVGNDAGGGDGGVSTGPTVPGPGGQILDNSSHESGSGGSGSSGTTLHGITPMDVFSAEDDGPGGGGGGGGGAGFIYAPGLAGSLGNAAPPPSA